MGIEEGCSGTSKTIQVGSRNLGLWIESAHVAITHVISEDDNDIGLGEREGRLKGERRAKRVSGFMRGLHLSEWPVISKEESFDCLPGLAALAWSA